MTDHQSDAELHMERLVQMALDCSGEDLARLSDYEVLLILDARREMRWAMLALAVRLAAGK